MKSLEGNLTAKVLVESGEQLGRSTFSQPVKFVIFARTAFPCGRKNEIRILGLKGRFRFLRSRDHSESPRYDKLTNG